MKEKKSIDELVAMLTGEQKEMIKKIHKVQMIITVIVWVVLLATVVTSFAVTQKLRADMEEARLENETLADPSDLESVLKYGDIYFDAYEKYEQANENFKHICIISIAALLVYVIVFEIVLLIKFPYYSEKKYEFIKKEKL